MNLLLRVSVELGVVVALVDWGFTPARAAAKIVLGVAAPLVGFGFWGPWTSTASGWRSRCG